MALLLVALAGAGLALGAGFTVTLGSNGPVPGNLAVNWGDTVTFSNPDSAEHGLVFTKRAPKAGGRDDDQHRNDDHDARERDPAGGHVRGRLRRQEG